LVTKDAEPTVGLPPIFILSRKQADGAIHAQSPISVPALSWH
jgi:hypothetical protein